MVAVSHYNSDEEPLHMTEAQYFEFDEKTDEKYEYIGGRVVAMTGASYRHNQLCANLARLLGNCLLDKNCDVLLSDLRVQVDSASVVFRYPDIIVVCDVPDFYQSRKDTITNPTLIIEVLSPSTQLRDRNEKLEEYLKLDSLREYLLVSQDEAKIERYLSQNDDSAIYQPFKGLESTVQLSSIDCKLALADVYHRVNLDADQTQDE